MSPDEKALRSKFYCKAKKHRITVLACLESYVWGNTLVSRKKRSKCLGCDRGLEVRGAFASGETKGEEK